MARSLAVVLGSFRCTGAVISRSLALVRHETAGTADRLDGYSARFVVPTTRISAPSRASSIAPSRDARLNSTVSGGLVCQLSR
jgi:hypothetical protein